MSRHSTILVAYAAILFGGCGGVTPLVETSPVHVMAEPPPPPPPPEEPPPPPPPVVEVTREAIEVHQRINFASSSDVIEASSFALMDEIVAVIQEHGEIRLLRIEGHTDNIGTHEYNIDLSTRRAASVTTYLTDHGVDSARLSSEGYGYTQPRDDNETDVGRAENRRVEFNILERSDEHEASADEPEADEPEVEADESATEPENDETEAPTHDEEASDE